jgi:hypothetical protein
MRTLAQRGPQSQDQTKAVPASQSKTLFSKPRAGDFSKPQLVLDNPASQRLPADVAEFNEGSAGAANPFITYNFGRIQVFANSPAGIQAKLAVSTPGDSYEQEAERVATQVMGNSDSGKGGIDLGSAEFSGSCWAPHLQPPPNLPTTLPQTSESSEAMQSRIVRDALSEPGRPLQPATRDFMEARLRNDFGQVRIHTTTKAAESARALGARAFTLGRDVVFGAGQYAPEAAEGRRLLIHELTHVAQQRRVGTVVQRYEAGEHAKLGETQAELQSALASTYKSKYTVKKGDTPQSIAKKLSIGVAELKEANKTKLRHWPAEDGSGRMVEGFNAGEVLSVPVPLNALAKAAVKDKSAKFTVNGVVLDYGVGIAMGDLFETPEQMAKASPTELNDLATLIKREQSGGKPVTTAEWQKASGGRYLKLAEKNVAHFAPQNPAVATPSPAGAASPNHQTEWQKHHAAALDASRSGDKDKALQINSFADHFLTDAFAAGHLINKADVMEQFKSQFKVDPKSKEFTGTSKQFFDDVAKTAFTGSVKTEFSKLATVELHWGMHIRIDNADLFSTLLQNVHKEEPDLMANAIAKAVHDTLNTLPGGLPVENERGDKWNLSGDGTLNADTMKIARQAVAQSQMNIISAFQLVGPLDYASLYKRVWVYTPKPSPAGLKQLVDTVQKGTDITNAALKKSIVDLINANFLLMIDELKKRKKLQKA